MAIELDVHIEAPERTVDMKAGLETLQGFSDAVRIVVEAVLSERVPKRLNAANKVRTNLKNSFSGSWGQIFSVDLYQDALQERLEEIGGKPILVELIKHFLDDAVFVDSGAVSEKAAAVLNSIGERAEEITEKLRQSPLRLAHKVSQDFGYAASLRYRKSTDYVRILCKFNGDTAETLTPTPLGREVKIIANVTRLNIFTGNGRLQVIDESETTAFGFAEPYSEVSRAVRRKLSNNLDQNNRADRTQWEPLEFKAKPLALRSGKIVKYLISSVK